MSYLPWIATAASLIGIVLNAKKKAVCWPVWLVGSLLWVLYAFIGHEHVQWPEVILWSTFSATNIYGWYSWSKDDDATNR